MSQANQTPFEPSRQPCSGRAASDRAARVHRCAPAGRAAFTLVELLVVMAIISLLISILTPSLARARQQAKATVCLTRLAEFGKGLTLYDNENHTLPPVRYPLGNNSNPTWHGWAEVLYVLLYRDDDFPKDEHYPVQHNRNGEYALFRCNEGQPLENSTGHYRVYDVSWALRSLDGIKPKLPIIIDANPRVTDPLDLLRSDVPREHVAGLEGEAYIDERHYGGCNFLFPDGHAERSTNLKEKLALDWDLDPDTPNR